MLSKECKYIEKENKYLDIVLMTKIFFPDDSDEPDEE